VNSDKLTFPAACMLMALYLWATERPPTVVVAYYGATPGSLAEEIRYAGDVATQSVRSISTYDDPETMNGCTVLDAVNWTCPGPSLPDLGGRSSISATDGQISVSNTKILKSPESRIKWKSARFFGPVAKLWGAT
jgi:hypothetical protein